jgi:hypothetical protein
LSVPATRQLHASYHLAVYANIIPAVLLPTVIVPAVCQPLCASRAVCQPSQPTVCKPFIRHLLGVYLVFVRSLCQPCASCTCACHTPSVH